MRFENVLLQNHEKDCDITCPVLDHVTSMLGTMNYYDIINNLANMNNAPKFKRFYEDKKLTRNRIL